MDSLKVVLFSCILVLAMTSVDSQTDSMTKVMNETETTVTTTTSTTTTTRAKGQKVLKCHQCTTKQDGPKCKDEYSAKDQFMTDCTPDDNVCMKTIAASTAIPTEKQQVEEHSRLISRFCGHITENWDECFATEAGGGYTTECYCRTDGCNGSSHLGYTIAAMATTLFAAIFMRV